MLKLSKTITCAAFLGATMLSAAPAYAQATRTWVSGVGDDVNPCSRTAPCKTFAGAISKTAAGGEINCLDPGGFGAVTITKSLTIDCHYTEGGALAGGNGIVVNALSTDVVVIRGLDIFGVSPPSNGVRFLAGAALHIEDCVIRRFNAVGSAGVSFAPSGASRLYIRDTEITGNTTGIDIRPTGSTGSARVSMQRVTVDQNGGNGLNVDTATAAAATGVQVAIDQSEFAGNASNGIASNAPGIIATISIVNSSLVQNTGSGLSVGGNSTSAMVSGTTITGNGGGVSTAGGSVAYTFSDNRLEANPNFATPNNGAFNGVLTKK